jgi:hypothetical protein
MNDAKRILEMNNPNQYERSGEMNDEKKNEKNVKMTEDNRMMSLLVNKMREMETEYDVTEHLVIDLGNAYTKIGFSGEDLPRLKTPSVWAESRLDHEKKNEFNFEIKYNFFQICS